MKPSPNSGFLENRRGRRLFFALLAVAPVGFLDSVYLAVEHYLDRTPPCSIVSGCETVTTSAYSVIMGIPLALLGSLYYLGIIIALVYYLDSRKSWVLKWTSRFTVVGFLFSLYLVYLQLFVLHAICSYCMLSALSSTVLFILGMLVLKSHREHEIRPAAS